MKCRCGSEQITKSNRSQCCRPIVDMDKHSGVSCCLESPMLGTSEYLYCMHFTSIYCASFDLRCPMAYLIPNSQSAICPRCKNRDAAAGWKRIKLDEPWCRILTLWRADLSPRILSRLQFKRLSRQTNHCHSHTIENGPRPSLNRLVLGLLTSIMFYLLLYITERNLFELKAVLC